MRALLGLLVTGSMSPGLLLLMAAVLTAHQEERADGARRVSGSVSDQRPTAPMRCLKPGNAGGGKGLQFKTDAIRGEGPGDWETYQLQ